MKTITSIREKIPNAKVYLFEQGISNDFANQFETLVDKYFYIGDKRLVRFATNSIYKGLGEAIGLLTASTYIPHNSIRIIKISGRYFLNSKFNLEEWQNNKFIFKFYGSSLSTRLYGISGQLIKVWKLSLILSIPLLLLNISIERTMPIFIPKKLITKIQTLGVSGFAAVSHSNELQE